MALKSANQAIRWLQRIGILTLGLSANVAIDYWYNWVAYPYLFETHGTMYGWLYATAGSIVLCLACLWFYNLTEQDWLGIETIKGLRDEVPQEPSTPDSINFWDWKARFVWWFRRYSWKLQAFLWKIAQKGDIALFFVLSIKWDPFITTVYMRRGADRTMTARDWKIFWASMLIGNLYWGAVIIGVLEAVRMLAQFAAWLMSFF